MNKLRCGKNIFGYEPPNIERADWLQHNDVGLGPFNLFINQFSISNEDGKQTLATTVQESYVLQFDQ